MCEEREDLKMPEGRRYLRKTGPCWRRWCSLEWKWPCCGGKTGRRNWRDHVKLLWCLKLGGNQFRGPLRGGEEEGREDLGAGEVADMGSVCGISHVRSGGLGLGEGGDGAVVAAGSLELKIVKAEYCHRYAWHPGLGWGA